MKVLHLETGTHVYGGALQVLLLVEGLENMGIENVLVAPEGSEVGAEALRRGLPFEALPMAGEADILFPLRFRKLIGTQDPDVVHLHSRRGADTLGAMGARWTGVPLVLTRRVDNPEPSWAVRAKYNLFDRVITISEAISRVLVNQGVDRSKLRCVRSALDPAPLENPCQKDTFLAEFGIEPGTPVVGMGAQFIPRKGHGVLLEAIPAVLEKHPGTRFLLFGKGPLLKQISVQIDEGTLTETVGLPGFRGDLATHLPCLDLLVHPATMEGLGVILLQAGAAGVPVVASDVGGIPEVVVHGESGLLVPPGDPEALASAVSALLDDPERAKTMGEAGRRRVRQEFSVQRMVEGNLDVYQELVARRN
ncbi:MAG: glycosyltransferase [Gemmatimonadetes bacterium]|nr:glycosyltransferase [Gemmatimonadota bacterium]NNM04923.1 glycosyltransferase [Gemmatimonadota bacterium]